MTSVDSSTPVTITAAEYARLLARDEWLSLLEEAGIDNAEAYEYACQLRRERHPEDD